ncbi:MAG: hypothetical protein FIA92_03895 [Chloroflexi bacterium]|nr:hypothetical protein [Chloroflexota bacterium]
MSQFDKAPVREAVADFLGQYGKTVADLHGMSGESAALFAARGMRVRSHDTGTYIASRLSAPREAVSAAMEWMGCEAGYDFFATDITESFPFVRTAYIDLCGPYEAPTSRIVRAAVEAGLWAFALTVELSRTDGGRARGQEWYLRHAFLRLQEDAPGYCLHADPIEYRGVANIPMAVFLLHRVDVVTKAEYRRLVGRLPDLFDERVRAAARMLNVGYAYFKQRYVEADAESRFVQGVLGALDGPWKEET